jgi:hypothetical protein
MITRYVGVFCAERKCHHFIVLSSQEASNPSIFGSDIDPTTSGKGIPCPKCGLTCHCCFLDKSENDPKITETFWHRRRGLNL